MAANAKIEVEDLHKSFGPKHVLKGVEFSVPEGSSLVIIGGSGSGKSVMLKCVLGLMRGDKGFVRVDGRETMRLSPRAQKQVMCKFGMLFQNAALFDSLPVWENVAFRLIHASSTPRREARDLAIQCLAKVGLAEEVAFLDPAELSGGMRKRVGLARAIASDPEILIFDEPTTGLDPIMSDVINNLIVEQVKGLGATAISITHDMASARKIADHIAMLYKGQIIWHGPASKIDDSGNPMVDQFIHGRAEGPIQMEVMKG